MQAQDVKHKVFDFVKDKVELERQKEVLEGKINILNGVIKSVCHHPAEHLKIEERLYSWDCYDDEVSIFHWSVCSLCGWSSEISKGFYDEKE